MRIAIVYSGHVRSFYECKQSHIELLSKLKEKNETKVFFHTYPDIEANTPSWWQKTKNGSISKINLDEIVSVLNPTLYEIRDFQLNDLQPSYFSSDGSFIGAKSMYKSFEEAYKLVENYKLTQGWSPDLIIKLRFDIRFNTTAIVKLISDYNYRFDAACILAQNSNHFGGISDILIIHRPTIKFDKLYQDFNSDNLFNYFKKFKVFYSEIYIRLTVLSGIKIKYFNPDLCIVRLDGNEIKIGTTKKTLIERYRNYIDQRRLLLK